MRTKEILFMVIFTIALLPPAFAKKKKTVAKINWEKVDFIEKFKGKIKVSGSEKKNLKNNPSFISDYCISNALVMKGSEKNAKGSVFSEVHFGGIPQDAFQEMVEELYQQFETELTNAGLSITDGNELLESKWAKKKKGVKGNLIRKTDGQPILVKAKIMDGTIFGYGVGSVKQGLSFRPVGKNIYLTTKKVYGNFYQNLSTQNGVPLFQLTTTLLLHHSMVGGATKLHGSKPTRLCL